jgi:hypothetical protein
METIYNWCHICDKYINREEVKAWKLIYGWADAVDRFILEQEVAKHKTSKRIGALLLCKECLYDVCSIIAQKEKTL